MGISVTHEQTANELAAKTQDAFLQHFGQAATGVYFAPGRINLIGEHLDYNGGVVMPAGISQGIALAIAPRSDGQLCGFAADLDSGFQLSLEDLRVCAGLDGQPLLDWLSAKLPSWARYPVGVARQLADRLSNGFDLYFMSSLPVGAGLSSSAAICSVCALALDDIFDLGLSRMEMAVAGQRAEVECVGLNCGLMDQFASLHGVDRSVLSFNCADLSWSAVPFALEAEIVLCHSGLSHNLAETAYNQRRASCETGLAALRSAGFELAHLAEARLDQLTGVLLDQETALRCTYVLEEMERVRSIEPFLRSGACSEVGRLLYETHSGLSRQYEVSLPELDYLVDLTRPLDSIYGARLMGGGFGGCTLNLIQPGTLPAFVESVIAPYREKTGIDPLVLSVLPSAGARKIF